MSIRNPRINVTVETKLYDILNMIAEKEACSVSSLCKELITQALERREDLKLSQIAELRENEDVIGHEQAW